MPLRYANFFPLKFYLLINGIFLQQLLLRCSNGVFFFFFNFLCSFYIYYLEIFCREDSSFISHLFINSLFIYVSMDS